MNYKRIKSFLCKACLVAVFATSVPCVGNLETNVISAATKTSNIKISAKTLNLVVGKSKVLKVTGTKKKVTWTTSNSKIATVSNDGKVTANKIGKVTITAKVNQKRYTCKVNVVYTNKFQTSTYKGEDFSFQYPDTWAKTDTELETMKQVAVYPKDSSLAEVNSKCVVFRVVPVGITVKGKDEQYECIKTITSEEKLNTSMQSLYGENASVKNLSIKKEKLGGKFAVKVSYDLYVGTELIQQAIAYDYFYGSYLIEIGYTADEISGSFTKKDVADVINKSVKIKL